MFGLERLCVDCMRNCVAWNATAKDSRTNLPSLALAGSAGSSPVIALLLHSIYAIFVSRKAKSEEPAVGNHVEQARISQGISRQELAQRVGVHYQTIGYIERGQYSPSLVLALQIARELSTTVEELFWLDREEKK